MLKTKAVKDEPNRVSRGGCWGYWHSDSRIVHITWFGPGFSYGNLGLRLTRNVNPLQGIAEIERPPESMPFQHSESQR